MVGTGVFLFGLLSIIDSKNMKVPSGLVPFYVGLLVFNIGVCLGLNTGYAINPATDFGARYKYKCTFLTVTLFFYSMHLTLFY